MSLLGTFALKNNPGFRVAATAGPTWLVQRQLRQRSIVQRERFPKARRKMTVVPRKALIHCLLRAIGRQPCQNLPFGSGDLVSLKPLSPKICHEVCLIGPEPTFPGYEVLPRAGIMNLG